MPKPTTIYYRTFIDEDGIRWYEAEGIAAAATSCEEFADMLIVPCERLRPDPRGAGPASEPERDAIP